LVIPSAIRAEIRVSKIVINATPKADVKTPTPRPRIEDSNEVFRLSVESEEKPTPVKEKSNVVQTIQNLSNQLKRRDPMSLKTIQNLQIQLKKRSLKLLKTNQNPSSPFLTLSQLKTAES